MNPTMQSTTQLTPRQKHLYKMKALGRLRIRKINPKEVLERQLDEIKFKQDRESVSSESSEKDLLFEYLKDEEAVNELVNFCILDEGRSWHCC